MSERDRVGWSVHGADCQDFCIDRRQRESYSRHNSPIVSWHTAVRQTRSRSNLVVRIVRQTQSVPSTSAYSPNRSPLNSTISLFDLEPTRPSQSKQPSIQLAVQYSTNPLHDFETSTSHQPHKMPIPESEYFLSRKPTVPPTFDGVDYNDNKALKAAQDAVIREQWVRSMMARLVRDEMGKCYRREGVNHLEKCGPLRGELCC